MLGGLHLFEEGGDFAVGADDESGALCSHVRFTVHTFFDPNAVGLNDGLVRVAEEREREIEFLDEFLVAFGGIDADAKDVSAFGEIAPRVADAAGLGSASRRVVFGIEVEHDGLVPQGGELDLGAISVGAAYGNRGKIGSVIAYLGCGHVNCGRKKRGFWQL